MKFIAMKLSLVIIAATVFAHGNSTSRSPRLAKLLDDDTIHAPTATRKSTNWGGAVVQVAAPQTSYYAVIGSFIAPDPKPPSKAAGHGPWKGSAWVGIDGWGDGPGLFQAGITWQVEKAKNGSLVTSFGAWHEWVPANSASFENFKILAGDIITVLCETSNSSSGVCAIYNHNTGIVVSQPMSAPSAKTTLVGKHAEWIVEDFVEGANGNPMKPVPLADFGKVEWFDCEAAAVGTKNRSSPEDAFVVDMNFNETDWTSITTSGKNMTIKYAG
jgi:hypothetical protein